MGKTVKNCLHRKKDDSQFFRHFRFLFFLHCTVTQPEFITSSKLLESQKQILITQTHHNIPEKLEV